jgi:tetratricopeptide (TPR) repeat protein
MRFLRIWIALCCWAPFAWAGWQDYDLLRDSVRRGDFARALVECDATLKHQPRNYQVWTLKGVALQGLGRNPESLEAFRAALQIQPEFLPALQGAAQLEYLLRDPGCERSLEKLLGLRPEPTIYAMLGALAFERKDCAAATKYYEEAGAGIVDPIVKWQRGACYFQLERWDQSAAQFRDLLSQREDDRVRYNLGLSLVEAKRHDEAIKALEPLGLRAKSNAAGPDAMSLLATAYESTRRTQEAIATLQRAIESYPGEERLYADLAALCLEYSAIPIGLEVLDAGAKNIPRSARIQTMLGVLYARGDQREKAEQAFQKAEKLAPEAGFGRVGMAMALLQVGAVDEAIRKLHEQTAISPDDALVNLTLAQALLQKDASPAELKEAQSLLERLVARQPGDAKAYSMLGKVYLRGDAKAKATAAFETALRLDSNDRAAAYQLMKLYRAQGKNKEAATLQDVVRKQVETERVQEADAGRFHLVSAPSERPVR